MAFRGFEIKGSRLRGDSLFIGGTLALVSNIFFLIEVTLGERLLYMPSVGFCVAVSFLLARAVQGGM